MGKLSKYWFEVGVVALLLGVGYVFIAESFIDIRFSKNRKLPRAFLAELVSALERYQIDHGIYPIHLGSA